MARYKSSNSNARSVHNNANTSSYNNNHNHSRSDDDQPIVGPVRRGRGRPRKKPMDTANRRRKPEDEIRRETNINSLRQQQSFDDVDRFYVVEKILEKRYDYNGNEEYLVRWQNYPPQWDSWEPRRELENNCRDMINEFNGILDPNRSTREDLSHCICKEPYRFDKGGMIQCFKCNSWFHFKCLNMNMEQANAYARYYCKPCLDKDSTLENLIKPHKQYLFPGQQDGDDDDEEVNNNEVDEKP